MNSLDDIMSELNNISPSDNKQKTYTVDDLDYLMSEVENQETRRRAPLTKEVRETGVRKTTTRQSPTGALDGNDLDAVLDTIIHAASRKLSEKKKRNWMGSN